MTFRRRGSDPSPTELVARQKEADAARIAKFSALYETASAALTPPPAPKPLDTSTSSSTDEIATTGTHGMSPVRAG